MSAFTDMRAKYPFPWGHVVQPNGLILVFDANRKQVPLLDLIAFAMVVTAGKIDTPATETPSAAAAG